MIDADAPIDANLTIVGTVKGSFAATAESAGGTHKAFSFTWNATQWLDGKDAVATDDETIQLTVKATKPPAPPAPTPGDDGGQTTTIVRVKKPGRGLPKTNDITLSPVVSAAVVICGISAIAVAVYIRRKRQ